MLYTYDGNGNLTVSKDPLGRSTTNSYDALNRLTQVLDPASGTTKYAYNGNGSAEAGDRSAQPRHDLHL